jgi:ferredoxin
MSLATFKLRMTDNVPGIIYVGDQCLDCDLCRETAPEHFARNDEGGYSYVKRQPETPEEFAMCLEAIDGCCTGTIFADGNCFDWTAFPAPIPYHLTSEGQAQHVQRDKPKKSQNCCAEKKPSEEKQDSDLC